MNKYQKKSKIKRAKDSINKKTSPETKPKTEDQNLIFSVDNYFDKHINKYFSLSLVLTIILSIYLFDVKIHEGGDDSGYIEMAYNFINGKSFPSWHGEFYSIFLGLPIKIFGLNVVVLKIFSLIFLVGHLIFFYLAFKNRISSTLLVFTLLLTSVSSNILFFGSQTYTESLYMFLQVLALFILFKLIDHLKENKLNNLELWHYWLSAGVLLFLSSITRNIGITLLISILILLLYTKKFYAALYTIVGYYIFSLPFQLYKKIVWNVNESGITQQLDIVLYKNPYNAALGKENFSGMVTRFIENTKIYLSRYFFQSVGLKDPTNNDSVLYPALALVVLFLIAFYFALRKNRYMLLIGIYLGGAIFTTFVTLAQSWGQLRMIVIFIPLIMLFTSWGLYELSQHKKLRFLLPFLLILFVVMFFKTFGRTIIKAKENQKVLSKNIEGNKYYGFTPDWVNFLKMSEWVGKNIPDSVEVASRRPSMSFIYSGGKEFYGIYKVPTENGDSLMNYVKNTYNEVTIFNLIEIKKVPANLQVHLRQKFIAFLVVGNDIFGIIVSDEEIRKNISQFNMDHFSGSDQFIDYMHNRKEAFYGVQPELLINTLRKNGVRNVIIANLRTNPQMKTENIISTVQRYLYFIELKYPNIFTIVHQIGAENDEPAKLIRINYEYYGL